MAGKVKERFVQEMAKGNDHEHATEPDQGLANPKANEEQHAGEEFDNWNWTTPARGRFQDSRPARPFEAHTEYVICLVGEAANDVIAPHIREQVDLLRA